MLALIISIAGSFKAYDHFYIMTQGGPLKTTQTIVMYINKVGFEYYDIGRGSAISVLFLIILLIISYLQLKLGDSLMIKVWTIVILSIFVFVLLTLFIGV